MHLISTVLSTSMVLFVLAGPVVAERTSFYGVESDPQGVWWFRGPGDERFLSLGVSDIPTGPTRDQYDAANPAYAAFRYYGSTGAWARDVRDNLQRWGFNTVGAWGHPLIKADGLPESAVLHWGGTLGVPWCDVFSRDFEEQIESFGQRDIAPRKNDSRLLGWFSDNELQWYVDTIFWFHLHHDQPTATRDTLVEMLREFYDGDFAALRADFDPGQATKFDELGRAGPVYLKPDGQGYSAVNRFTFLLAERYYRTVRDAIRRHDPHHLILGDRYMSYCPPVVAKAAGPYVDVISTNFDWPDWTTGELPTHYLRMLHAQSGKPVLISEWYVAARQNRSGNRNTGESFTKVETQAQRAVTAERRIDRLVSEPYVVGAHWFRYADEPTNGRSADGEDFNFGLVDIHNQPYEQLTAAMQRANQRALALHANSAERDQRDMQAVSRSTGRVEFPGSVERFTPLATDDTLSLADLRLAWDDEHVYVGLVGFRFVEQRLLEGDTDSLALRRRLSLKLGDSSFNLRIPTGGPADERVELAMLETNHRHRGVRFTYLVTIPSQNIAGIERLERGVTLPFEAALTDPGDGRTTWRTAIVLDKERELAGGMKAAANPSAIPAVRSKRRSQGVSEGLARELADQP